MEELRREQMYDHTEILLFDILAAFKSINEKLNKLSERLTPSVNPVATNTATVGGTTQIPETPITSTGKICKSCGLTHNRPIEYAICARKNKKG